MSRFNFLIVNKTIPDISYRTNPPEETIHPRVIEREDGFYVYCQKVHVPLSAFILRLAAGESGMWVAGYRPSNGRQSTISFDRADRVSISPRLHSILAEVKTTPQVEDVPSPTGAADEQRASINQSGRRVPLTPEQLEIRMQRQAEIGKQGELAAYRHECVRLAELGCTNPVAHVTDVSQQHVGAGYDIRTEYNGERRCIEVKSSVAREDTFFISENERSTLQDLGEDAYIYMVLVDETDPKASRVIREIRDPFNAYMERFSLSPTEWAAKLID